MYFQDKSHIEYLRENLQIGWFKIMRNQKKQKKKIQQSLRQAQTSIADSIIEDQEDQDEDEEESKMLINSVQQLQKSSTQHDVKQGFKMYLQMLVSQQSKGSKMSSSNNDSCRSRSSSRGKLLRDQKQQKQQPIQSYEQILINQQLKLNRNQKVCDVKDVYVYERIAEILILNTRIFELISFQNGIKPYDLALSTAKYMEYVKVPKNTFLFHFGESPEYFYIVLTGQVSIWACKSQDQMNYQKGLEHDIQKKIYEFEQQLEKVRRNLQENYEILKNDVQVKEQIQELEGLIQEQKDKIQRLQSDIERRFIQSVQEQEKNNIIKNTFLQKNNNLNSSSKQYLKMYKENNLVKVNRIALLKCGAQIGEAAIIQDDLRSASAFTDQETELLIIQKSHFTKLFKDFYDILNFSLSKLSSLLVNTQKADLINFSYCFEPHFYKYRDFICRQGDKADMVYLVQSGQVELCRLEVQSCKNLDSLQAKQQQQLEEDQQVQRVQNVDNNINFFGKVKSRQQSPLKQRKQRQRICILSTGEFFGYEDILEKKARGYDAIAISERVDILKLNKNKLHNYPQDDIRDILKKIAQQQQKFHKSQQHKYDNAQKKVEKKVKKEINRIQNLIEYQGGEGPDVHQIQESYQQKSRNQIKKEKLLQQQQGNRKKKSVFSSSSIKEPNFQIKQIFKVVKDRKYLQKYQRQKQETNKIEIKQQRDKNIGLLNFSDMQINSVSTRKKRQQYQSLNYQQTSNSLFTQWMSQQDIQQQQTQENQDDVEEEGNVNNNNTENLIHDLVIETEHPELLLKQQQSNSQQNEENQYNMMDESLERFQKQKINQLQYQSQQSLFQLQQLKQQKLRKRNMKACQSKSMSCGQNVSLLSFFENQIGPHIYSQKQMMEKNNNNINQQQQKKLVLEKNCSPSNSQQQSKNNLNKSAIEEIIESNKKYAVKRLQSSSSLKKMQQFFPPPPESQQSQKTNITNNVTQQTTQQQQNNFKNNNNSILSSLNKSMLTNQNNNQNNNNYKGSGATTTTNMHNSTKSSLYESIQNKIQSQILKQDMALMQLVQKKERKKKQEEIIQQQNNNNLNVKNNSEKQSFSWYKPSAIQELAKTKEKISKKIFMRQNKMHPSNLSLNEKALLPMLQQQLKNKNNQKSQSFMGQQLQQKQDKSVSRSPINNNFYHRGNYSQHVNQKQQQSFYQFQQQGAKSAYQSQQSLLLKDVNDSQQQYQQQQQQKVVFNDRLVDIQKRKQFQTNILDNALQSVDVNKFPRQKKIVQSQSKQQQQMVNLRQNNNKNNSSISPLKRLENTLQELNKQKVKSEQEYQKQKLEQLSGNGAGIKIQSLQGNKDNRNNNQVINYSSIPMGKNSNNNKQQSNNNLDLMSEESNNNNVSRDEKQIILPKWTKDQQQFQQERKNRNNNTSLEEMSRNQTEREMLDIIEKSPQQQQKKCISQSQSSLMSSSKQSGKKQQELQLQLQQQQKQRYSNLSTIKYQQSSSGRNHNNNMAQSSQFYNSNGQFSPTKQYPSLNLSLNLNQSVFSKSTQLYQQQQQQQQQSGQKFSFQNIQQQKNNETWIKEFSLNNINNNNNISNSNNTKSVSNSYNSSSRPKGQNNNNISIDILQQQQNSNSNSNIKKGRPDFYMNKSQKLHIELNKEDFISPNVKSQNMSQSNQSRSQQIFGFYKDSPIRRNFRRLSQDNIKLQISQQENIISQEKVMELENEEESDNDELQQQKQKKQSRSHINLQPQIIDQNQNNQNNMHSSIQFHSAIKVNGQEQQQQQFFGQQYQHSQQYQNQDQSYYQMEQSQPFKYSFSQAYYYQQMRLNQYSPSLSSPKSNQYNQLLKSPSFSLSMSNPSSPFDTVRESFIIENNSSMNNLLQQQQLQQQSSHQQQQLVSGYGSQRQWRAVKTPLEEDLQVIRRSQISGFNKYTKDNKFSTYSSSNQSFFKKKSLQL